MTAISRPRKLPRRLRKASYTRLYIHMVVFAILTVLLLGLGVYGLSTLMSTPEKTFQQATDYAHTQTLARNFKNHTLANKILYTAQDMYLALLIVGLLLGVLTVYLSHVAKRKDVSRKYTVIGYLEALDYLLPFLAGLLMFTIFPLFNVVLLSFKEKYKYLTDTFSSWGFANFDKVLNDSRFTKALLSTGQYVLFVVPISTCLSLAVANLLNRKLKFSALFQTAYFLPMVTAATATGLAWKFMFQADYGLINYALSFFGVSPIKWLTNSQYNIWALIIYGTWNIMPFTIILLLSGLQNIDEIYYTAAKVDGAKPRRIFFRITVPLLAPTISLVLIINSISCAKVFNELFPLFNGNPGVSQNLYTVVYYIYNYAFNAGGTIDMGRAAAASIVLFLILFVFTMLQLFIQRKWQYH